MSRHFASRSSSFFLCFHFKSCADRQGYSTWFNCSGESPAESESASWAFIRRASFPFLYMWIDQFTPLKCLDHTQVKKFVATWNYSPWRQFFKLVNHTMVVFWMAQTSSQPTESKLNRVDSQTVGASCVSELYQPPKISEGLSLNCLTCQHPYKQLQK